MTITLVLLVAGVTTAYWAGSRNARPGSDVLENKLVQMANEMAVFRTIIDSTSQNQDLDQALSKVLQDVMHVLAVDVGGIYLQATDSPMLNLVAHQGIDPELVAAIDHLALGEGFSGRVALTGKPLAVDDIASDTRLTRQMVAERGLRGILVVPVSSASGVLGTMFALARSKRAYSYHEIQWLISLGKQIGIAIENFRLLSSMRRRAEQFRVISELGRQITSVLDESQILSQVVHLIFRSFGYYSVAIALVESDEVAYKVGAGQLWDQQPDLQFSPARLRVGKEGLTGWVAATGEPLLVPDVSKDSRYVSMAGAQTQSELLAPIKVKGQVLGVLDIQSTERGHFDESDLLMAQSLADQTAVALENARLYQQARQVAVLEERQRLARELHDSVTQAMYGVTLYAEAAARRLAAGDMGLTARHLQELKSTAQDALREMRLLIFELRPSILEEHGLTAALEARLESVEGRAGLDTAFHLRGQARRLPADLEAGLYRIAQEALNNALKHSQARHIEVSLCLNDTSVTLEIADDGQGFLPDMVGQRGGLGLPGMRERAAQLNGALSITSTPGEGTTVRIEVPR